MLPSQSEEMYQLKTMCLSKRAVKMPNKEEHGNLLFYGLGARRWEIGLNCNSSSFKEAILNIYPRLRSSIGYTLWTLAQDKTTFNKMPEKVNTPQRICSYLGAQSTGCLIIVPLSDIRLMGEQRDSTGQTDYEEPTPATSAYRLEPTNNNIISNLSGCAPTALISSALPASSLLSSVLPPPALTAFSFAPPSFQSSALGAHHLSESPTLRTAPSGPHNPTRPHPYHVPSLLAQRKTASRPTVLKNSDRASRSLCLMCGKMERTAGTGSFHNILTEKIPCSDGEVNIAKKLNEILGINVQSQRKKLLASDEICKKCLRLVTDMLRIEEALRNCKERLVSSFFSTMARLKKNPDNNVEEDEETVCSESYDVIQRHAMMFSSQPPAPAYLGLSDYGGSEAGSSGNSSTSPSQDKQEYAPMYPGTSQAYFATPGGYHAPSQAFSGSSRSYFERVETFPGSSKAYLGPSEAYIGTSPTFAESVSPKRSALPSHVSPGAFDEASFSSTQSHRSWSSNSILSKAQQKEYPEMNSTQLYKDDSETEDNHNIEVAEDLSMETAENLSIDAANNLSIEAAENLSIEAAEDLSLETTENMSTRSTETDLKRSTDMASVRPTSVQDESNSVNAGPLKKRKVTQQETIPEASKDTFEVEDKRIKVEVEDIEDLRENDLYELD